MNLIRRALYDERSRAYHIFHDVLSIAILVSVVTVIVESVRPIAEQYASFFFWMEIVFLTLFSIEYVARVITAPRPLRYIVSPMGIVDFIAILPSFLVLIVPAFVEYRSLRVLRVIRILRLLRLFRVLKLIANAQRQWRGRETGWNDVQWYNIQVYLFAVFTLIVIAGTLAYLIESDAVGTAFTDIPQGMWWAVQTMSSSGYGDIIPQTGLGKLLGGITMISGLALFAMLVTVMGRTMQKALFGSFLEEEQKGSELQKEIKDKF